MLSRRLHVDRQRREAEQPHVAGRPSPGWDPAVPWEGQRRPQGAVTPGETHQCYLSFILLPKIRFKLESIFVSGQPAVSAVNLKNLEGLNETPGDEDLKKKVSSDSEQVKLNVDTFRALSSVVCLRETQAHEQLFIFW